jgi:multisubunit Na+/H+ antiporter MnhG subunit
MKWSAHLTPKRYVITQFIALPVTFYVYFMVFAFILGFTYDVHSVAGKCIATVLFFVLMLSLFAFLTARRVKRMRRLAKTDVMEYEIAHGALVMRAGKDMVSVPLSELSLRREGKLFMSLKRQKARASNFILFFDDEATKEQIRLALEGV